MTVAFVSDVAELSDAEDFEVRKFGLDTRPTAAELTERHRLKVLEYGGLTDPSKPERDAEMLRARMAPAPVDGQLKTPDEMIDDLEWAKHATGRIALTLKESRRQVKATRKAYRMARARILQRTDARSSDLREAEIDLACEVERDAWDDAEIVLDFAKDVAHAADQTGSMTQTQAGLVKAQMALAGTGRES